MWLCTLQLLICAFHANVTSAYGTDQQRLMKRIFKNYNKILRPVAKSADVINMTLNPLLFSIVDTNEAAETITIVQWFGMTWNDFFLQWNASEYGEVNQLLVPMSKIWYPDIVTYNMIDIEIPISEGRNHARIDYDGTVHTYIDQLLTIRCDYHVMMFPFDIQNCTMNIGSWSLTVGEMDVFYSTPTDMSQYNKNSEWDLISMTARKSTNIYGTGENAAAWTTIFYDIVIQRKPTYYLLTFVLPCFMITTVSIIGIFAPFNDAGDREEKITMGLTTLLTMTVLLTVLSDRMPKSSKGLPLLGYYILLQIGIATVTSLITVFIMCQSRKWTLGMPVPDWILTVTRLKRKNDISSVKDTQIGSTFKQCFKINNTANCGSCASPNADKKDLTLWREILSMFHQVVEHLYERTEEECLRKDWQLASERLDLILMLVFLLFNVLMTVTLLIVGFSNLKI